MALVVLAFVTTLSKPPPAGTGNLMAAPTVTAGATAEVMASGAGLLMVGAAVTGKRAAAQVIAIRRRGMVALAPRVTVMPVDAAAKCTGYFIQLLHALHPLEFTWWRNGCDRHG